MASDTGALSFQEHVRSAELVHAAQSRKDAGLPPIGPANPLAGLALSGGGIRSATFNLGILQALAEVGKLRRFDYLSTVSGGGYIGGWLTAWIHRRGLPAVEAALADSVNGQGTEPVEVRWLAAHSNYLTPRKGLLSLDTLWGGCTYVRNLVINQMLLVAIIVTVLLVGATVHIGLGIVGAKYTQVAAIAGLVLILAAAPLLGFEVAHLRGQAPRAWAQPLVCWLRLGWSPWIVAGLALGGATLESYSLARPEFWGYPGGLPDHFIRENIDHVLYLALPFPLFWFVVAVSIPLCFTPATDKSLASMAQGQWIWLFWQVLATLLFAILQGNFVVLMAPLTGVYAWLVPLLGPVLYITAMEVSILVLILLAGRTLRPYAHDWLSRIAAVMISLSILPIAVFVSWALLAPTIDYLVSLAHLTLSAATIGWLVSTAAGVLGGKSPATGGAKSRRWVDMLLGITPYIFLLGLFTLVVYSTRELLGWASGAQDAAFQPEAVLSWLGALRVNLQRLDGIPLLAWPVAAFVILVIALLLAWRVDINLFSFHSYYRNRLAHAYLGASATRRKANAFTGYAPGDSPLLQELATMPGHQPMRPFPLVNTALNLSGRPRAEWQQRKAGSFVFSPLYCGYEFSAPLSQRRDFSDCPGQAALDTAGCVYAHRRTSDFVKSRPGRSIGQSLAITISGAAASPNMGYHTSPAVAALMTAFNVRLGWWMPNPRMAKPWAEGGPDESIKCLLRELTANAHEEGPYVYLSDGGHFENLGVYELLRRRCGLVVASDASADPLFRFEDLGNLVRKARVDFGIEIEVDPAAIRPVIDDNGTIGSSASSFAFARINYPPLSAGEPSEVGWLVYVKSSLPPLIPADVDNYRRTRPGFPHQSTSDQWFDESQFESYRRLGLAVGRNVMAALRQQVSLRPPLGW